MNKRWKEVLTASLNDEKKHLKWLEQVYSQAQKDTADKIAELSSRKDLENLQTIVYQKQYQEAIQKQINDTLDRLHSQSFKGISDYMNQCYVNGYVGAMYDIAGQGIPIIKPIDEVNVLRAIQTDSKLSKGLYNRLGEDINALKLSIRAEVSRGIIEGSSWNDIATHIAKGMNSPFNKSKNIAMRIARTEGHRIQNEAQMDAITTAKDEGADVLKQWDATLDDRTRESHQMVDGEVREIDEEFSNGLMFPSDPTGDAEEVINCRCALTQRARWALDEDELETLKDRASYFGLDKSENFEDFKDKYLKLPDDADTIEIEDAISEDAQKILDELKKARIEYNEVQMHDKPPTEDEIINALSGGDMTGGSCASLGFAYIGQKNGMNVLDFRGGKSREYFSVNSHIKNVMESIGIKPNIIKNKYEWKAGREALATMEEGKEYYLTVGRHASIVRNIGGNYEYLEMQSPKRNGWNSFESNTFSKRFGCAKTPHKVHGYTLESSAEIYDISELKDKKGLQKILGHINTAESSQKKGSVGSVK